MFRSSIKRNSVAIAVIAAMMPTFASAQASIQSTGEVVLRVIGSIVPALLGLGLVVFLWGITKYFIQAGDPKARDESKKVITFGVVGLFVMSAVWVFVRLLTNTIFPNGFAPLRGGTGNGSFAGIVGQIVSIISSTIIPIVFGLALLFYLYNVVRYIAAASNASVREQAMKGMFYGIVGLFVMVSVWGLVGVLSSIFGSSFAIPTL